MKSFFCRIAEQWTPSHSDAAWSLADGDRGCIPKVSACTSSDDFINEPLFWRRAKTAFLTTKARIWHRYRKARSLANKLASAQVQQEADDAAAAARLPDRNTQTLDRWFRPSDPTNMDNDATRPLDAAIPEKPKGGKKGGNALTKWLAGAHNAANRVDPPSSEEDVVSETDYVDLVSD